VVGFDAEGVPDHAIDDSRLVVPEFATIVVGDFILEAP
jgi:hypothetical protein